MLSANEGASAVYKVLSDHPELKRGKKFTVERAPLETGKLYLFRIDSLLILGRWFPGWIIQPGRWIEIDDASVRVLGRVARFPL